MCNPGNEALKVLNKVGGRPVEEYFPQQFIQNFPPHEVQSEHCLVCGTYLPPHHMRPPDKMPRYMCDYCYQQIALRGPKYQCLTCGGQLPQQKIQSQEKQPRELKHALHDGICSDYHWMLAGIVLGVPFRIAQAAPVALLPPAQDAYRLNQYLPPRQASMQMIEGRTRKPFKEVKFLRLPRG